MDVEFVIVNKIEIIPIISNAKITSTHTQTLSIATDRILEIIDETLEKTDGDRIGMLDRNINDWGCNL
jgi:hypothetical protein